jgi:Ca-activated chloride channel homolog
MPFLEHTDMRFAAPVYVHLWWLVPGVLGLYLYAFIRKRQCLALFIDPAIAPRLLPGYSQKRQWCKALCLVGAVGCLVLALMQPQWGVRWQDLPSQGRALMFVLDVSRSMLAEDVLPNRLERAKDAIRALLQVIRKEGGHRLGLVVFAGRAQLYCPLTLDYAFFLQRLTTAGPDTVAPGGTALGDAILRALADLATAEQAYKDIILLTDGEDHDSSPLEAARAAAIQQVSLYIIGLGETHEAARIPIDHAGSQRTYLRYQGEEVRSLLQSDLLQEMARLTGGVYVTADPRPTPIQRLYTEQIAPKARQHSNTAAGEYLVQRYHWFVLAAVLLMVVEMLIQERQSRPRAFPGGLLLLLCCPALVSAESPATAVQRGNVLYEAEQYDAAAQQYTSALQAIPEAAEILFNLGNVFYKQQGYITAQEYYLRALRTRDLALASRVKFNLGNVYYQLALQARRSKDDAVTPLRTAIAFFRDSLEIESQYQEARYNLELAYALLRKLQPSGERSEYETENGGDETTHNQGQSQQHQGQEQSSQQQEAKQGTSEASQEQPAESAHPQQAAFNKTASEVAASTEQQELSREEAEQLLNAIGRRTQEIDDQRRQWRRARVGQGRVTKDW